MGDGSEVGVVVILILLGLLIVAAAAVIVFYPSILNTLKQDLGFTGSTGSTGGNSGGNSGPSGNTGPPIGPTGPINNQQYYIQSSQYQTYIGVDPNDAPSVLLVSDISNALPFTVTGTSTQEFVVASGSFAGQLLVSTGNSSRAFLNAPANITGAQTSAWTYLSGGITNQYLRAANGSPVVANTQTLHARSDGTVALSPAGAGSTATRRWIFVPV